MAAAGTAIPIAIQYLPYASVRPTALRDNLLTVSNEQVYDVAGRTQSPYQTNLLFAAAPILSAAPTNTVSFLFRRNLYLASNGAVPSSIYLDFGDGRGYQPATWNQPLATTYATAGTKRVKVKAVFNTFLLGSAAQRQAPGPGPSSTVAYESHFDFLVLGVAAASRYGDNGDSSFFVRPANAPYGATVSIRFGRNHGHNIVKPFIMVEQFNIASVAPNLRGKCNNYNDTIEQFIDRIGSTFTGAFNFDAQLEAAGYDLIYVDFQQNTDDITRNARVVEQLIQLVNQRKVNSQGQGRTVYSNVVMGMSMGGLIARYALAEMTKNTALFGPPDTRLLVLHDSPQRGAYSPLGLQSFTRSCDVPLNLFGFLKLRDFKAEIDEALIVLDEPASQQLAILNAFNGRGTDIRGNTFIDGVYKDKIEFSPSDPQPGYQIVATSDGSQCGRGSGAPLGVQLSSVDSYSLINFLTPLSYGGKFFLGVRGAAYGLPAYGQQATISRMRVYIEYRICIGLGGFFTVCIPIRYNLLNESATSPPNTLPYETLPGGTSNLAAEAGDCATPGFFSGLFLHTGLYNGPICFVPSYSALDVATVTPVNAASAFLFGVPPMNNAVPRVSKFIAQANLANSPTEYNLNHLTFTPRNSEWIFNEMQQQPLSNVPLNCASECNPYPPVPITGPDIICANNPTTFTVAPPFGVVTGWSASPTGLVTLPASTAGATSITVVPASSSSTGLVTLTARISNGCYNTTATRQVAVGQGLLVVNDNSFPGRCAYQGGVFTLTEHYGATGPYTWFVSQGHIDSGQGSEQITVSGVPQNRFVRVYITVTSPASCPGAGSVGAQVEQDYYEVPDCLDYNRPAKPAAALYPNPARETVDVRIDHASAAHPVTVRLYDSYGQPRAEQTSTGEGTVRLKTDQLPAGLYFVHLLRGSEVLSREQLRIEK